MRQMSMKPAALLLLAVLVGVPAASAAPGDYRGRELLQANQCGPAVAKFQNTYSLDIALTLQGLFTTADQCCSACFNNGYAYWNLYEVLPNTGLLGGLLGGVGDLVGSLVGNPGGVTTCSCLTSVLLTTSLLSDIGLTTSLIGETGRPINSPLPLPDPVASPSSPIPSVSGCNGQPLLDGAFAAGGLLKIKSTDVTPVQCCSLCAADGIAYWQLATLLDNPLGLNLNDLLNSLLPGTNLLGGLKICSCLDTTVDILTLQTTLPILGDALKNLGILTSQIGRTSIPLPPASPSPSGPGTSPSGPGTSPSGPGTSPSGPGTSPSGPGTSPSGPGTSPSGPGTSPSRPGTSPSGPTTSPSGPSSPGTGNSPVIPQDAFTVVTYLVTLGTCADFQRVAQSAYIAVASRITGVPANLITATCQQVPGSDALQITLSIPATNRAQADKFVTDLANAIANGLFSRLVAALLPAGSTLVPQSPSGVSACILGVTCPASPALSPPLKPADFMNILVVKGFNNVRYPYSKLGRVNILISSKFNLFGSVTRTPLGVKTSWLTQVNLVQGSSRLVATPNRKSGMVVKLNGKAVVKGAKATPVVINKNKKKLQRITVQLTKDGRSLLINGQHPVMGPIFMRVIQVPSKRNAGLAYLNFFMTVKKTPTAALGGVIGRTIRPTRKAVNRPAGCSLTTAGMV